MLRSRWALLIKVVAATDAVRLIGSGGGRAFDTDRSMRWSMIHLAVALAGLAAFAEALIAAGPLSAIYAAYLFPAAGALYVATGLLAWARRPANRLGSLMTACGTAITLSSYGNTAVPALVAVGAITSTLPLGVVVHLVHACPTGVVGGRAARITVFAAYLVALVLQVPIWAFTPEQPPFDVLLVSPRPDLARTGVDVQKSLGLLVLVATVWLLGRRLRAYGAADRRLLAALVGFALLSVVVVAVGGDVLPSLGLGQVGMADVQIAAVALVPLGFLLVVLRGGFTPPAELAAFAGTITSAVGSPDAERELERAVGAALGDPTAVVLRWSDGEYRDVDGRPVDPAPGLYRSLARIDGADAPLGAIVHDTALDTDPVMFAAVTHVAGIALERDQLAQAVAASRAELQEASQRVLLAADAEPRRITRDLHDGLQGALVLLSLQARELVDGAAEDDVRKSAAGLADGVDAAAATLRDIVNGVMPSPLVERGIRGAVADLAENLPMGVAVSVSPPDLTLPASVETTAYFVIAEAVTNVLKHARATRVEITVALDNGDLSLQVVDDGVGAGSYTGGSGLAGLRDRLVILGGTVETTRLEVGTRVRALLPCA